MYYTGCVSPIVIKNPKYAGGRNDEYAWEERPCGRCDNCLRRRQRGWTFRLLQEAKVSDSCCFITLTYDDYEVPYTKEGFQTLYYRDLELFFKRIRERVRHETIPLKYYACGEYGPETYRPHYHAIVFNLPERFLVTGAFEINPEITAVWKKGIATISEGTDTRMNYVAKYIQKKQGGKATIFDEETGEVYEDNRLPEKALISKNLGKAFLTDAMIKYLRDNMTACIPINGYNYFLPRYYIDKVFNSDERKKIYDELEEKRLKEYPELYEDEYLLKMANIKYNEKVKRNDTRAQQL